MPTAGPQRKRFQDIGAAAKAASISTGIFPRRLTHSGKASIVAPT
jgi:hypothetical protein